MSNYSNIRRFFSRTTKCALDTANKPSARFARDKSYRNLNQHIIQSEFLRDNRGKAGIYMWTNLINGNTYIGSSVDLSPRFLKYFNENALKKNRMLICLALLKYNIENFSLDILEYCSKEDVIKREQHYLDTYKPKYNILKTAGSSLGFVHTEDSLSKLRSRVVSEETLELMRKRVQTEETKKKISNATGISIKVIDVTREEVTMYSSKKEAAACLGVSDSTIGRFIKSGKLLLALAPTDKESAIIF